MSIHDSRHIIPKSKGPDYNAFSAQTLLLSLRIFSLSLSQTEGYSYADQHVRTYESKIKIL